MEDTPVVLFNGVVVGVFGGPLFLVSSLKAQVRLWFVDPELEMRSECLTSLRVLEGRSMSST